MQGQVARELIICRDMTLFDARSGHYPLVRGINHHLKFFIGQNSLWQITARTRDTCKRHAMAFNSVVFAADNSTGISSSLLVLGFWCSISSCSVIFCNTPLLDSSTAVLIACENE